MSEPSSTPATVDRPVDRPVVFASFATHDYQEAQDRLGMSLSQFNLTRHLVSDVDDRGWDLNTHRKPEFLLGVFNKFNRVDPSAVVWVDSDAVVRQTPVALLDFHKNFDVALCRWERPVNKRQEILSGTAGFTVSPLSRALLWKWRELCEADVHTWDQKLLAQALEATPGVRVLWLPIEYCFIHDTHRVFFPGVEPVIEHFQMSRVTRSKRAAP